MSKKIGILTGGGDCPGLNPAIRGVVFKAIDYDFKTFGIQEGWRGLIEGNILPLRLGDVEDIIDCGGTVLGASRVNPYKVDGGIEKVLANIKEHKLDALIAMGGEDTLGMANKLSKEVGVNIVGVPKTMDNDISGTDYTFGFDSSVTRAMDAMKSLKDTGRSHRRIMVLEVMGRHAGWVALFTGISSGADWILIPEVETNFSKMYQHLLNVYKRKKYALVVTAEGIETPEMKIGKEELDQFGHMILRKRKVGENLAQLINEKTGIETRSAVIGHMQRGGPPTLFDRILGTRCGVKAADLIAQEKFGRMVALRGNEIIDISLDEAVAKLKIVNERWWNLAKVFFK